MDIKGIALMCAGMAGVGTMGYFALSPTKPKTNSPPNSSMDALGGAGLIAGSSVFLLFFVVAVGIIGIGYLINKASQGDVDKNIERAGKIKNILR
jgi:hypothetical protein